MSDREKIRAEFKGRLDKAKEVFAECPSSAIGGIISAYENVVSFIDNLPKEPMSEDLKKVADDYANKHSILLGFDCDAEPIQTGTDIKDAVIYGARWQKEKILKESIPCTIKVVDSCHVSLITSVHDMMDFTEKSTSINGGRAKLLIIKED